MFLGLFCGDVLGVITGVNSNVGGVGFAMLALILISGKLMKEGKLSEKAQEGISFWSALYIPIVVAMTACQDVASAITGGGVLAIIAGSWRWLFRCFWFPCCRNWASLRIPCLPSSKIRGDAYGYHGDH